MGETFYNIKTDGTLTTLGDIAALSYNGNFKGILPRSSASTNELNQVLDMFKVYPVPSTGTIKIETNQEFKLEVVDVAGSVVQNHSNVKTISIEKAGVYFLRFIEADKVYVQKVVTK